MRKLVRWTAAGLGVLLILFLLGAAYVYGSTEYALRRTYEVEPVPVPVPNDPASVAEGKRLARIRGCYACHGERLQGTVLTDVPNLARVVAPNLSRIAAEYSDAELARAIRDGVKLDGTGVGAMPSDMFYHLSDSDVGAIIAAVRDAEPADGPGRTSELRLLGRLAMVTGDATMAVEDIDQDAPRIPPHRDDPEAFGRYLAKTSCTECHGAELEGQSNPTMTTPPLRIVEAYSLQDFRRLMRTGIATGDRELSRMTPVARGRFAHLTDEEIEALYAYLSDLGEEGPG